MELLAIRTARLLTFFSTAELNPRGLSLVHTVVPALVERFQFLKYPQKAEDFDDTNGVKFEGGTWNSLEANLVIFTNGIMVDTRSSTSDCEKMLQETLEWAQQAFGMIYRPEMLSRKAYLSELEIKCDIPLDAINPRLKDFSTKISERVHQFTGQALSFTTTAIWINFDSSFAKGPSGPFRVERLVDAPFAENRYYSSAPLPTETHLFYLEEFESILSR